MDVLLVEFIGSGIVVWASGVDDKAVAQSRASGLDLVRRLAAAGDRIRVEALVGEIVTELWQEWRNSRRTRALFSAHLAALPEIVMAHRPDASVVTGIIAETGRIRRQGGSVDLVAHRLTSEIILGARSAGIIAARDLDETLCFFLVSRLLSSLLSRHQTLMALRPAITYAFGGDETFPAASSGHPAADDGEFMAGAAADTAPAGADPEAATARPVPPAVERIAEDYVVPVALLVAAIGAEGVASCDDRALPEIEAIAARCAEFIAQIATIEATRPAILSVDVAERLRLMLADGELAAADVLLADADVMGQARHDGGAPGEAGAASAATTAIRVMRARLAEIAGDWRNAARLYAYAVAGLAPADRLGRGPLLSRQAAALVAHGSRHDDDRVLLEAAQIYAEAGGFLSEEHAPLDWAQAHVDLGELLLLLGAREARPERFLAAALHFKPAVDVFSRLHAMDRWTAAQFGLATALKRTGEFQGDVVTLGDAAFAFRAALGLLTKDRAPKAWAEAQVALGETLVRIAEETGETDVLEDAVPALKAALAQPSELVADLDVGAAKAALGRAYVSLAASHDDETMLQEAITLLESALDAGIRALSPSEAAAIDNVRGTALWSLGESRTSVRLLEDAVRAKLSALEHLEASGGSAAADRVREDLDALADAIQRLEAAGAGARTHDRAALDRAS